MGPGRMAGPSAAFGQVAYTIRLPMEVGALAEVLYPDGSSESMGKVRVLPVKTRYPGFTASRLGEPGSVWPPAPMRTTSWWTWSGVGGVR